MPVGRRYGTRDEAIIVARQVCRTAWRAGMTSPDGIDRLLDEIEAERERRREEDPAEWARRFPEILSAALKLDRYFQARGCTVEVSLEWTCRALQKLRESNDVAETGARVESAFSAVWWAPSRGRPWDWTENSPWDPKLQLSDYERKRIARNLDRLPIGELEILTCWADSSYGGDEISILLQSRPGRFSGSVGSVFEDLGSRPAEELKETCSSLKFVGKLCGAVRIK